jgi:hypothetical protein
MGLGDKLARLAPGRLERRVRAADPGLLRARHAAKTLLAVLVAVSAFTPLGRAVGLLAAIAAGFTMQCTAGRTRRVEALVMSGMSAWMMLAAALGHTLAAHRTIDGALVVACAFGTFYARRFLPAPSGFTLFAFVFLLIATVFPTGSTPPGILAAAAAGGAAIAILVYLLVLPRHHERAIPDAVVAFGESAAAAIAAIARVPRSKEEVGAARAAVEAKAAICAAIAEAAPDGAPGKARLAREPHEAAHAIAILSRVVDTLDEHSFDGLFARAARSVAEALAAIGTEHRTRGAMEAIDALEREATTPAVPCPRAIAEIAAAAVLRRLCRARDELGAALRGGGAA